MTISYFLVMGYNSYAGFLRFFYFKVSILLSKIVWMFLVLFEIFSFSYLILASFLLDSCLISIHSSLWWQKENLLSPLNLWKWEVDLPYQWIKLLLRKTSSNQTKQLNFFSLACYFVSVVHSFICMVVNLFCHLLFGCDLSWNFDDWKNAHTKPSYRDA